MSKTTVQKAKKGAKNENNAQLQSSENVIKNRLEQYLTFSRNRRITADEIKEYKEEQRNRLDVIYKSFWIAKYYEQPVPYGIFQLVKIEYIASPREFYVIPIYEINRRIEFQNQLNHVYHDDCEPVVKLKVKDLCIVYYDMNWCRAKVISIVGDNGNTRLFVHLVDYGRNIYTLEKYVGMLKLPHDAIYPFVNKCQLSLLRKDDNVSSDAMVEQLERISKGSNQIAIYFNSVNQVEGIYDVTLISDCQANVNTTYDAYLLHEAYSAFDWSAIKFDDNICKEWSEHILQYCTKSTSNHLKKHQVQIAHIVSPNEIYVKSMTAEAAMPLIRRKIYQFVRKYKSTVDKEWSVGEDCLVRVQNWRTEVTLKLWCRGRIVEVPEEGQFKVFLRDYGRSVNVTVTDLRPISVQLAAPANAVQKCRLNISDDWTESATSVLEEIVQEYLNFAITCSGKDGTCLLITLWATNSLPDTKRLAMWDDIGLRLVSQSIIKSMRPFIKKSQRRYNLNRRKIFSKSKYDSESDTSSYESLNLDDDFTMNFREKNLDVSTYSIDTNDDVEHTTVAKWPPALPISNACITGFVTHVTAEGIFYAQEESNHEFVYELEQRITRRVKRMKKEDFKNGAWKKGDTCFAWRKSISFEEGVYCRAVIEKIDAEYGLCLINYVDYGKNKWFKLDDLYPATKYGDIPILVNRFYDSKLVPAAKNGKWTRVVWEEFTRSLIKKDTEISCVISVDQIINIGEIKHEILPCTIEARVLPTDMYHLLLKKKLAVATALNANDDGILKV